ncbi:MAG: sigma-70 family RNA polymerase sigma factor [Rhizobiaceae bacterium]|nr:sigma-70 family RNA polymerase sigma factor [Rhizobiaceae bacterium]
MDDRRKAILDAIPELRRYARALLRDRDASDDLVQDCLERALSRMDNWRTGDNPRKWLLTIMHRIFLDQLRREKRRGEKAMLPLEDHEAMAVHAETSDGAASRDIVEALQAISPERRAAILIVSVEGFSYAEAASILGVPAGTLMSRIARGREELRALIEDGVRRRSIRMVEP